MDLRFLKSERGIGTVVASVMFLMISILFIGGTFVWQSTAQNQMIARDKDRMDERISVQATHKWNGEKYVVTVKVSNIGIIDVEIVRLWILDMDHNEHLDIDISSPLSVGDHASIAETEIDEYSFDVDETSYYFKVVTARGNIANSLLMPYSMLESQWPAIIIPGASYVTKDKHIHLEVYNSLDETITIDLIVATRHNITAPKTDMIDVEPDWLLIPGDITVGDFWGDNPGVYIKDKTVLIELVNIAGLVVSSYYFTVQG